jgi:(1->4)-alpha-D-glucan 1-alpha-D-glucosylmutase
VAPGRVVSLAQTLIKLTGPGVPDIYQGSEIWNLSLVDPDNRRPVDFELRRRLVASLATMSVEEVTQLADDGLTKLWVIKKALGMREKFGPYVSLDVTGARNDDVVAYSRGDAVTVAPRFPIRVGEWGDTAVEVAGSWENVFTGERGEAGRAPVSGLFGRFPVALLALS